MKEMFSRVKLFMCVHMCAYGREKELKIAHTHNCAYWSHRMNVPTKVKTQPMPLTASDPLWGYIQCNTFLL